MPKIFDDDLFSKIIDEANFYKAYKQTQKGKSKFKPDAMKFALDETYNLTELKAKVSLMKRMSWWIRYISVFEPNLNYQCNIKKDKIVQIAINNIIKVYYPA